MGLKAKRRNVNAGLTSRAMIIPASLDIGEESTIAANRLLLADVRGKISEEDLLEFLETKIEPIFWKWYEKKFSKGSTEDDVNGDNS